MKGIKANRHEMNKQQALAFATQAMRDGVVVCVAVKNRPYRYVGRVTRIFRDAIQVDGTAYGFKTTPHRGHYFVRASGVTVTSATTNQQGEMK